MRPTSACAFLLLLLPLVPVPVAAAARDQGGFWHTLGGKLEQLTPQKKTAATSAVGGIRGAKDLSADLLHWKGEVAQPTIDAEEYARFKEALVAGAGGSPEAVPLFEAFLRDYPSSTLRADATAALQQLQAAAASAPAAGDTNPVTAPPAPAPLPAAAPAPPSSDAAPAQH